MCVFMTRTHDTFLAFAALAAGVKRGEKAALAWVGRAALWGERGRGVARSQSRSDHAGLPGLGSLTLAFLWVGSASG